MADPGLLDPGTGRLVHLTDDAAMLRSLLEVEVAWGRALAEVGAVPAAHATVIAAVVEELGRSDTEGSEPGAHDRLAGRLALAARDGGNPVIPLVSLLRDRVAARDQHAALAVHRGLTSQDVLDSALMHRARDVLARVTRDLDRVVDATAALARAHRDTPMVGRTLTQHAVPTTFGLHCVQWFAAVVDARASVVAAWARLPVQCGGAVGTRAALDDLVGVPGQRLVEAFAGGLGLAAADLPWHTRRGPVTRLGDALTTTTSALGKIATDVLTLTRPEIGEVTEPVVEGRGGSSTMPQKRNPVLSVLIRSHALQAPPLSAQLHTCAALAVDDRPDGPWHAEWPALARLLTLAAASADLAAELTEGLVVHPDVMRRRLAAAGPAVLGERISARLSDLLGADGVAAARQVIGRAAAGEDVRTLLRSTIPPSALGKDAGQESLDALLDDLLDPVTYLGESGALVDRALRGHRSEPGEGED